VGQEGIPRPSRPPTGPENDVDCDAYEYDSMDSYEYDEVGIDEVGSIQICQNTTLEGVADEEAAYYSIL
jgi:hypothetical protein